ncbi:DedA family protein [Peribacillus deserti]|uniref:Alkaline phosphatase n=1 Tax=Peribacillus deserti TaxID=673318 RepID=A0A2N5M501_9BACI|nr:DedA family protein [Peribacillus deserti]PLT29412.1 alkaline phosphatase [Peribacillus deserti]
MQQHISILIEHYGYIGIIAALAAGIIGLPLPDEVLLTFTGYQVFKGEMLFIPSLLSASAGAIAGISISYFLGIKLGMPFLRKYGPKIHLSEARLAKTRNLFNKLGPILLLAGYFIPGIRHVTAYLAGINGFSYRKFSFFAYSGAILWTFTFISLGRSLGKEWLIVEFLLSKYSRYAIISAIVIFIAGYFFFTMRKKAEPR